MSSEVYIIITDQNYNVHEFWAKKRKSPKFRKALAAKDVDSFDSYVQKFSPKLRKMKQNQIEELLENDQYNAIPGTDDDAKHWLTPLTGRLKYTVWHVIAPPSGKI